MWGRLNVGTVRLFKDPLKFLSSFLFSVWLAEKQLLFHRDFFIPLLILKAFNANIFPGSYPLGSNKNRRRVATQVPRLPAAVPQGPKSVQHIKRYFLNDVFSAMNFVFHPFKISKCGFSMSLVQAGGGNSHVCPRGCFVLSLFLCFDGRTDVSGLILPMSAGCSPVHLLWSHPHNSQPVSPSGELAFRFPGSV